MMAAGDRLIDVLKIERELHPVHMSLTGDEALLAWKKCRRTVERLAEDYAWAVANWRQAVEANAKECARVPPPRSEASEGLTAFVTFKVARSRSVRQPDD